MENNSKGKFTVSYGKYHDDFDWKVPIKYVKEALTNVILINDCSKKLTKDVVKALLETDENYNMFLSTYKYNVEAYILKYYEKEIKEARYNSIYKEVDRRRDLLDFIKEMEEKFDDVEYFTFTCDCLVFKNYENFLILHLDTYKVQTKVAEDKDHIGKFEPFGQMNGAFGFDLKIMLCATEWMLKQKVTAQYLAKWGLKQKVTTQYLAKARVNSSYEKPFDYDEEDEDND